MDINKAKSLYTAINCLEYMQHDLTGLGMDRAVAHIGEAIHSISESLTAFENEGPHNILILDNHRR